MDCSKKSYSIQTSLFRQDHFTIKQVDATLMSERFAVFENNMSLKMSKIAHYLHRCKTWLFTWHRINSYQLLNPGEWHFD
jgi:hypothetical protein